MRQGEGGGYLESIQAVAGAVLFGIENGLRLVFSQRTYRRTLPVLTPGLEKL